MAGRRVLCSAILFSFLVAVRLQYTFYHTKSPWNVLSAYKTGSAMLLQRLEQLLLFKSDVRSFIPNVLFEKFNIRGVFQFIT